MPNSIFNGNPMYLPGVQYNFEDYVAPELGIQASAGQTPYDRWLFAQNTRMGNIGLPSFSSPYTAVNPSNPYASPNINPMGTAPGSNGVYTTNPYQPVPYPTPFPWQDPVEAPGPAPMEGPTPWPGPTEDPVPAYNPQEPPATTPAPVYQPPAPEPTYQPPQTAEVVVGPYSNTPQSAEETARLAIRAQLQGLVASGDQEAALNYMNQNGITSGQFEEMLAYNGSPITSGSPYGWLANASQNTGIPVAGLSYASPEEVDQFIAWQQGTPNSMTNQTGAELTAAQGITDPYSNATIRDNALQTIRTQSGLQSIRNANGNNWAPEYQSYTPQTAPQPSPLTQVQNSVNTVGPAPIVQESQQPQYQQVAGSFVNQDTGDIVTYDSNGAHTSTGRIDPAWLAAHQPAPQPAQQTVAQPASWWDTNSENRARGGLIKLSQKYAAGGGVNALAGKYNLY